MHDDIDKNQSIERFTFTDDDIEFIKLSDNTYEDDDYCDESRSL
ncbi:MAG: hypothetical protein UY35_C0026G0009 [Candidatus Saccharibacteria bacterium GW2011_GWC2_48_9]|nr:MAG: hypothetical protein UY35_C0026G0009 [Candidatus Saccharibacteria bacterium GW2011_GWC2_48_9]